MLRNTFPMRDNCIIPLTLGVQGKGVQSQVWYVLLVRMSGPRSGVAKQLRDEEPRALYLHCHGHALNLAAGDAIKHCKHTKDAMDVAFEVSKLIKYSAKRTD